MKNIILLVSVCTIFSCTNTQVTSSWKAEGAQAKKYQKVLVMGILNEKDRSLRGELENQLVGQLRSLGYDAVSALEEHGPKAFTKFSEEELAGKLSASGYDAVLTTVMLDQTKDRNYRPGSVTYQPVGVYYNRFGRYYTTIYDRVYTPGYYTTSTNFFLESNLYDIDSGELVYSVQGKTFDPSSPGSLSSDYARTIIKDMRKNGILVKLS